MSEGRHLLASRAALEAEVETLRGALMVARAEALDARSQTDVVRIIAFKALLRYGDHGDDRAGKPCIYSGNRVDPCICGFHAAIAALKETP